MTKPAPSTPYVNVSLRPNRTASGRRTAAPGRQAARYIAYGQRATAASQLRGQWVDSAGKPCSQAEVMAWVREGALSHQYTAHAVLSIPEGTLNAAAYRQALAQGGQTEQYHIMVHTDTAHNHAHVIFFWDKRLDKETYLAWQTAVQDSLQKRVQQQTQLDPGLEAAGVMGSNEAQTAQQEPQIEAVGYGY